MSIITSFICLAYHRLTDAPAGAADPYTVRPELFAAHMAWLARRGYRALPLGEALATREPPPAPIIALSFDDGYRDFRQHAYPILQRHGFRATLFVVAGRLGRQADWPGAGGAPLLAGEEVAALAAEGMEIGAHGWQHRPLPGLDRPSLARELVLARRRLSRVAGTPVQGLAYPYGQTTPAVEDAVRAAGFAWAATARSGRNGAGTPRLALRRLLVRGDDRLPLFIAKVTLGYASLLEARMDLRRLP